MILKINRSRFTWQIIKVNFKTKEAYTWYIQLSCKSPWLIPRVDRHFSNLDIPLYGWLFLYFGRVTEGVIYETQENDAKIRDKKSGTKYYMFSLNSRKEKDIMRTIIKNYYEWNLEMVQSDNGESHLKLSF